MVMFDGSATSIGYPAATDDLTHKAEVAIHRKYGCRDDRRFNVH
jgi:hypothetical protein